MLVTQTAARPVTFAALATAVGLVLASCGVAGESTARPIAPPSGNYQALSSPKPAVTQSGTVKELLYLTRDGKLVRVERRLRARPPIGTVLQDLLAGPTDAERDSGLTSSLLGANIVKGVTLVDDRAIVELSPDETVRTDAVLAFAQIVCTLSARPEVNGVSFVRDNQPVGVPRADGSLSTDPLSAIDYLDLVATT